VIDWKTSSIVGVSVGWGALCWIPRIVDVSRIGDDLTVTWWAASYGSIGTLACMHGASLKHFLQVPAILGTVTFVRIPK
jgi:hypothetical protein